jgi:hypothetical protein
VAALEEELGTVPTEPTVGDELQHDPVDGPN